MKNEPSNKEYSLLARYDLDTYVNEETELLHFRFVDDATEPCVLAFYTLGGADVRCAIRKSNDEVEDVSILSLYVKREHVPLMKVTAPKS